MRVLLIEDDRSIAQSIELMLTSESFKEISVGQAVWAGDTCLRGLEEVGTKMSA
jgi:DNA-binding response OmpR family regulator